MGQNFEDELLQDAADDAQAIEFIQQYLPQEVKEKFTEDDLYYFLDVLADYYQDLLERVGDQDEVDIDVEAVAAYIVKQSQKDKMGPYEAEDVRWVVDADLEFTDQLAEEE